MNAPPAVPEVLCFGEALVDMLPAGRGAALEDVESFRPCPGGAVANVAIGLARLGVQVGFGGLLGDDGFGRFLQNRLRAEGVDTSRVRVTSRGQTGVVFITLGEGGERRFYPYPLHAAEHGAGEEHVDPKAYRGARVLHFGGVCLVRAAARAATRKAIGAVREGGGLVSFDVNLRLHLWDDPSAAAPVTWEFIRLADVVKLSEEECSHVLPGAEPDDAAARVAARGPRLAAVTLGPRGCVWAAAGLRGRAPAPRVDVVDTTGAGDAFDAGMIAGLLAALDQRSGIDSLAGDLLAEVFRVACLVGSAAVTRLGAVEAIPRRDGIDTFLFNPRGEAGRRGRNESPHGKA